MPWDVTMKKTILVSALSLLCLAASFAQIPAELNVGIYSEIPAFATGPVVEFVFFPFDLGGLQLGVGIMSGFLFLIPDLSSFAVPVQLQAVFRFPDMSFIEICVGLGMMIGNNGIVFYGSPAARFLLDLGGINFYSSIGLNITMIQGQLVVGFPIALGVGFPLSL